MKKKIKRHWSFSGMATTIRILLMQYINFESFFESPEKDLKRMLEEAQKSPPISSYQLSLF
jgi:transposase domain protein